MYRSSKLKAIRRIAVLAAIIAVFVFAMAACGNPAGAKTPLSSPENVRVEAGDFSLHWDEVDGAEGGYQVNIDGVLQNVTGNSVSLESLTLDPKVYPIRVRALAGAGNATFGDSAYTTPIYCDPAEYVFEYDDPPPPSPGHSPVYAPVFSAGDLSIIGLTNYGKTLVNIVIPRQRGGTNITGISNNAFANNNVMVSVVISSTIETIGNGAFSNISNLVEVTFTRSVTEGITSLGDGVFDGSNSIETVNVPFDSINEYKDEIPPVLIDKVRLPPPEPPTAAMATSPVIVTATQANVGGAGSSSADATITINLTNATVRTTQFNGNASTSFSTTVLGLNYYVNATAGENIITITITGTPQAVSTASATIIIPEGFLNNDNSQVHNEAVVVSGSVNYNINRASDPEITGFRFSPAGTLRIGSSSTAAGATIGDFSQVTGGTLGAYTYTLVSGTGSTDNTLFVIDGNNLKVGTNALTADKTYDVRVRITDIAGKTFEQALSFEVLPPPVLPKPQGLTARYLYDGYTDAYEIWRETVTIPSRAFLYIDWEPVEDTTRYALYQSDTIDGPYTRTEISTSLRNGRRFYVHGGTEFPIRPSFYFKIAAIFDVEGLGVETETLPFEVTMDIRNITPNTPSSVNITREGGDTVWFVIARTSPYYEGLYGHNSARWHFWFDNVTGQSPSPTNTNFVAAYTETKTTNETVDAGSFGYSDFGYYVHPQWPLYNDDERLYIRVRITAPGSYDFMYNQEGIKRMTPDAPANFSAIEGWNDAVRIWLEWDRKLGANGGYEIWRSDSEDGVYELSRTLEQTTTGAAITYYEGDAQDLVPGATYWYKVRSYRTPGTIEDGYSDFTAPIAVTAY